MAALLKDFGSGASAPMASMPEARSTLAQAGMKVPSRIVGFERLSESEEIRLEALGLRPDSLITKLMPTPLRDPIECLADNQLIALDTRLCEKILVETV